MSHPDFTKLLAKNLPFGVQGAGAVSPDEFARYLGYASWLMSMSEEHKAFPLSALDDSILPAIMLKQFRLFAKGKMPIAFVTWAMLSDEALKECEQSGEAPELKQWRSGKNLWIVECVSPFGPEDTIRREFLASMKPRENGQ